ncbi:HAD family hydrolase [Aliarcobacter butzleri]|jgi:phosphoglycolate phosphatase|uniref:phosphoglycolate phosphatase n=1 Tax=Aliarcobacter butzleri L355 TaxID=1447263 RepID=A0A0G9KWQ8_9BACT|nr:HAD family hydrolase [Aliarcobacter butzleri]EFU69302.1 phosphoglycolate phosphatase [Aliarcobacter butzleri JV22]KLE10931.1 HAD family hydrolase [Aliarcobacter butzleri L355]MCG3677754.1 HAD family hydrolase [Aliarcobacter butzleri]MCG3682647.1 HAD family hydrolase [Aliarcobacter butzleri]MCG3691954.1 HAD family hydrolase [Aliarcobacter butzleri]
MKLIIFDMDGTLINSGFAIANTVNYVRENLGFERLEKDYILENVNDPKINSAEFFYGTKEFTEQQAKLFEEYYNKHCLTDLVIYDGILKLLDDLKSDFTLAVATNANSIYANKMLTHLELNHYFSSILGYNDVKNPKPHPEMVNKLLDIHQIKKQNAQLIGDSHKDIMAATNAGVDSVLVNWGFSNHTKDAIESVSELEKRIKSKFFI